MFFRNVAKPNCRQIADEQCRRVPKRECGRVPVQECKTVRLLTYANCNIFFRLPFGW